MGVVFLKWKPKTLTGFRSVRNEPYKKYLRKNTARDRIHFNPAALADHHYQLLVIIIIIVEDRSRV